MILPKVACMSINLQRRQAIIVRNPMGIEMEKAGDQRHPRPPPARPTPGPPSPDRPPPAPASSPINCTPSLLFTTSRTHTRSLISRSRSKKHSLERNPCERILERKAMKGVKKMFKALKGSSSRSSPRQQMMSHLDFHQGDTSSPRWEVPIPEGFVEIKV